MKYTLIGSLLIFVAVLAVAGCRRAGPPTGGTKIKAPIVQADPLKAALDHVRQAREPGNFREALHQLNAHLSKGTGKQPTPLAAEDREAVAQWLDLTAEETPDLDGNLFRPLDASYLENCALFRDAARSLEIAGLPPLQQARVCFDWVMRQVLLHEQADEGVPPAYVLRRGFGGCLDRALVFLTLLRQFQMDACLVAFSDRPGKTSGPLFVGVLLPGEQKPALYLFDPLLGQAVPGTGPGEIATLTDVTAHPDLLARWAIKAEEVPQLFQTVPIEALSARMRFLQDLLEYQDKIVLFQDALKLRRDLAQAAGRAERDIRVWDEPTGAPSPARALRAFLPVESGGIDRSGRLQRFKSYQLSHAAIIQQFQDMRLLNSRDLPEQARDMLFKKAQDLYDLFYAQPREYFLHGQYEAALRRLDRIRTALETEEAARPLEDTVLQNRLNAWRTRATQAYLALLVRKEADGGAKVGGLWNEDQYYLNLVHVDGDEPLQTFEKKTLSLILFTACKEPLGLEVNYLVAAYLHEKAAKLQATKAFLEAAGKDVTHIKVDADFAWRNARGAWLKYLGRYQLSPPSVSARLAEIQQRQNPAELEIALYLWERLHLDIHATLAARLRLAEAQTHLQGAQPSLQDLTGELVAWQKSEVPKRLKEFRDQAGANQAAARRLDLLARDWAPRGNLDWLLEAAKVRADKEAPK